MTLAMAPEARIALNGSVKLAQEKGYEPPKQSKPTDDELAAAWLSRFSNTVHGLGEFRRYSDGWWAVIPEAQAEQEIAQVLEDAKPQGIRPTAGLLASVKKLAQAKGYVSHTCWDSNFDILVCENGTLDIPQLALREHRSDDHQTSAVAYDYAPGATAPTWMRFLGGLDDELPGVPNFLQEFVGYALTTDMRHEMAVWLCSEPGTGKSTFIAGVKAMLGARCGLLGLAELERSSFALTNVPGKTLLVSAEQPTSYLQSTHIVNKMISGETITVDRKFRDPIEIVPRAKIIWAMNELPRVGDANNGLFRRVQVIRFPKLKSAPDPEIKLHIEQEGAGILNWALAGLKRLRDRGRFDVPVCVKEATANFKYHNDIPAVFVGECCLLGPDYKVQSKTLYEAYKAWCIANGHKPQSSTGMATEWERLGFDRYWPGGVAWWKGVGLLAPDTITGGS
jgi:putative DNA primase/helicase